jgi:periplasmic divalent cation tolerance protein
MKEPVVAMTTTNQIREARSLAEMLVKGRLAACVQIVPKIESVYEWEGKVCDEQEYLLIIKTFEDRIQDIKKALEEAHSYELPEFLVLPVLYGADDYVKWMEQGAGG